jgi:hypothetical protein
VSEENLKVFGGGGVKVPRKYLDREKRKGMKNRENVIMKSFIILSFICCFHGGQVKEVMLQGHVAAW